MGFLNNELNHKQQSGDFVKMIKQFFLAMMVCIVSLSQTGCGLSIVQDWQASGGKAITGGGAIAGKDYVSGLKPSENARKYFAKISANDDTPIETIRRTDDSPSKTGVRFVKNGGILIPPGVTISFTNRGYCMDPHLPAPKAGEEFQLVPVTQLIPEDLQGIYKKLVTKASSGDPSVQRNMQHLIWALRTAGTDAAFANNLTPQQKRILDRCSEYPGQFEEFNANAKANSKALKELIGLADSFLNVKIGNVSYKASDLLDPDVGNKKINEHLNQLIGMSQHLPVEKSDFNFGEIQPGIYTDILGTDYLQYRAKIANTTNKSFIYYPSEYVGQVGSSAKNSGLAFYAAIDTTMRQRVTGGNPKDIQAKPASMSFGERLGKAWNKTVEGTFKPLGKGMLAGGKFVVGWYAPGIAWLGVAYTGLSWVHDARWDGDKVTGTRMAKDLLSIISVGDYPVGEIVPPIIDEIFK